MVKDVVDHRDELLHVASCGSSGSSSVVAAHCRGPERTEPHGSAAADHDVLGAQSAVCPPGGVKLGHGGGSVGQCGQELFGRQPVGSGEVAVAGVEGDEVGPVVGVAQSDELDHGQTSKVVEKLGFAS